MTLKLSFIGAAHEVTGSCTVLELAGKYALIDCGMEQGKDIFVNAELPVAPTQVDCILLTHAHMDHAGLLPLLYKNGCRAPVYATEATVDLLAVMLADSAHIQQFEAEWKNRKNARAGRELVEPLYTLEDVNTVLKALKPQPYHKEFTLFEGLRARFWDAGHLLGSASIEAWLSEDGVEKKMVFSGDIGNLRQPLLRDPELPPEADYVMMESTYGDRSHGERPDYVGELTAVLQRTFDRGGNVVIPSFAVGRAQVLLYFLRQIKAENRIHGHDGFAVYVDSPLANEATTILKENMYECCDEDTLALLHAGVNPISFAGLKASVTSDDSKAINFDTEPKVILSASGMCDAGRIKHHLKHNLWRPENTVLFVGYQAEGSLGGALINGARDVKLFGESIEVKAEIAVLSGMSGHADNEGLMRWAAAFAKHPPQRVFVNHGEDSVCDLLAARLRDELHYEAAAPYSGDVWDLAHNVQVAEGSRRRIEKGAGAVSAGRAAANTAFGRLLAAAQRLLGVAKQCEGMANKELARFADQVTALCDKWQR